MTRLEEKYSLGRRKRPSGWGTPWHATQNPPVGAKHSFSQLLGLLTAEVSQLRPRQKLPSTEKSPSRPKFHPLARDNPHGQWLIDAKKQSLGLLPQWRDSPAGLSQLPVSWRIASGLCVTVSQPVSAPIQLPHFPTVSRLQVGPRLPAGESAPYDLLCNRKWGWDKLREGHTSQEELKLGVGKREF